MSSPGPLSYIEPQMHLIRMFDALDRHSRRTLPVIFFLGLALVMAAPLVSKLSWMVFVQDDLFYYLQVARNIAHGHGSTFNGIVPTNGYQPLWLMLLVPVCALTSDPTVILSFVVFLGYFAAIATFLLARALLARAHVRPLLAFVLSAIITLYSVTLFFYGMEVILTVPILLAVVFLLRDFRWIEKSAARAAMFGLLLSAMVLSRIDTTIFAACVLTGVALSPTIRARLKLPTVLGTALGLVPVAMYFGINRIDFGIWLPVSGMAKQLKLGHAPSLEPWRVFFHPLAAGYAVLILGACALLPRIWHRLSPMERILYPCCLLFPVLYYLILSCVSDWTLWGWYMYPIRVALCISFTIFCLWPPLSRFLQKDAVSTALLVLVFAALSQLRWTHQQVDIYKASVDIQQFEQTHPGIYAMGDRAGRVAWLIDSPVIQMEGLMMDRNYLHFVQEQMPLRQVLAHYGVRYYVATAYDPFTGCFQASEPAKAGPHSAHMRAEFCEKPVETFTHEGVETLIYDLRP